jgi:hypothetical protein
MKSERNTLRAYELVIPAGAPGGGGYGSPVSTAGILPIINLYLF